MATPRKRRLTAKQEQFARAVAIQGKSYSEAYRLAYPTEKYKDSSVWVNASKTRDVAIVAQRIEELQQKAATRLLMSRQQYLERLEGMILADIRAIMDPQGNVLDVQQFPDDVTELVEGIEVVENFQKVGDKAEHVGFTKKIKFAGKRQLLKDYGEARGWLEQEEHERPKRIILRKYVQTEVHYHADGTAHTTQPASLRIESNGHCANGDRPIDRGDQSAEPSGD